MSRLTREHPQEPPCVWVNAGVLSYRPCHRDFRCESCELYRALRGPELEGARSDDTARRSHLLTDLEERGEGVGGSREDAAVSSYLVQLTEGCDLHLDVPYSPSHFWIQENGSSQVLMGFDCQTLRVLHPVDDFLLPEPGMWLKRGNAMGWIHRGHLALPLQAPISGEVLEVNHTLVQEIKKWGFPRSRDRWLIRLKPHEPVADVPGLMRGEAMLGWYQRKLNLVHTYLLEAVDPGVVTGQLLNDGGVLNRNLEEVLGTDAFEELLDRLFKELPTE